MARPTQLTLIPTPGRYETLQTRIYDHFGETDAEAAYRCDDSPFEEFVVEMFTVKKNRNNEAVLEHFFSDEIFEPVLFPTCIHDVLRPGDLFMISLGLNNKRWYVTWMSPMYH